MSRNRRPWQWEPKRRPIDPVLAMAAYCRERGYISDARGWLDLAHRINKGAA